MLNRKADIDDLADLTEPLLDKASIKFLESFAGTESANFIESLPTGKLIITTARLFSSAKNYYRERYLKSFLQGLKVGDNTMEDFNKLNENDKSKLRGLVISQLDLQSDEAEMKPVLKYIRQSQWRWDYGVASHGASFHAPQEITRILTSSIRYSVRKVCYGFSSGLY